MTPESLTIDAGKETSKIISFVRRIVQRASASGVVIGLSGGIDSAVVGALCVRALSKSRVVGLLMPSDHTPADDIEDALALTRTFRIRAYKVSISKTVKGLTSSAGIDGTRMALANVEARVRMTILYYYANTLGYLVAGTGDKSESLLGYFTKMGDGGVDLQPIAHLYKTQVRQLGKHLGLPNRVVQKAASPQLWPGHKASDEIPADYDKLDTVLHRLFDLEIGADQAVAGLGLSKSVALRALEMHRRSNHKRLLPPSLA